MRTSKILAKAKTLLWDGNALQYRGNPFVCLCIRDAAEYYAHIPRVKSQAKVVVRRINVALGEQGGVVTDWLLKKGYAQPNHINDTRLVQQYRQYWLNALIEEYEDMGD